MHVFFAGAIEFGHNGYFDPVVCVVMGTTDQNGWDISHETREFGLRSSVKSPYAQMIAQESPFGIDAFMGDLIKAATINND